MDLGKCCELPCYCGNSETEDNDICNQLPQKGWEKYLNNVFIEMEEKDVLETVSLSEMLALAYDIDWYFFFLPGFPRDDVDCYLF